MNGERGGWDRHLVMAAPSRSYQQTKLLGTLLAGAKAAPIDFAGKANVRWTLCSCRSFIKPPQLSV